LRFFGLIAGLGVVVWFLLSPWMSIGEMQLAGVIASDTEDILAEHAVVEGRPLILIRTAQVEDRIEADPWVKEADVTLHWPDEVVVRVVERTPQAWVETASGWSRRGEDGEAVPSPAEPDNTLGWVRLPAVLEGDAAGSDLVLGSIEFLSALPPQLAVTSAIRHEDGELWAVVDGYQVRLGRATEMREKAVSLVALLSEEIPTTSTLVLIAPTNPAVAPAVGT
jgi:cell division protein FtsQ